MVYVQNDEQDRLLAEALNNVRNQALQMKNCFEHSKLMDGLKFCSTMLNELRTSDLSPKSYYALYMAVVDELRYLEGFLMEEVKRNIKITDIYELVQYAGNIVPRLYLLITVGIVYIKTLSPINDTPDHQSDINKKSEIIKDLVEMCRGVQHPLRGLFLRYYLLQSLRNLLPDNKPSLRSLENDFFQKNNMNLNDEEEEGFKENTTTNSLNQINDQANMNGDPAGDREMTLKSKHSPIANGDSQEVQKNDIDAADDQNNNNDKIVEELNAIDQEEEEEKHLKSFQRSPTEAQKLHFNMNSSGAYACSVLDSVDFLLANFGEMNKLWVRMQHLGHSKDKEKRESERRDLRLLVGTNLVRMSELDNIGVEEYKKIILPGIIEQIICCRDVIAQEYIMECIIQVFPDEFHLVTLNTFLKACAQLNPDVKIKNIMICLINRLATYAHKEGPTSLTLEKDNIKLFDVFSEQISHIIQSKSTMISPEDIVSLQNCLINLALTCYPANLEYVDRCLDTTIQIFKKLNIIKIHHMSPLAKEMGKTVRMIIDNYFEGDLLRITLLKHLPPIIALLDRPSSYEVCGYLVSKLLDKGTPIQSLVEVNNIFALLAPLLVTSPPSQLSLPASNTGQPISDNSIDEADEIDAQIELAKLINLMASDEDKDMHFMLLKTVYNYFENLPSIKIKYSVPTIIFGCLKISEEMVKDFAAKSSAYQKEQISNLCQKLLAITKFVHSAIFVMSEKELHEMALRIYLQASQALDTLIRAIKHIALDVGENSDFNLKTTVDEFESIAYEFMSQCFSIYEDDIADSKTLFACLNVIISTFYNLSCFAAENHESLRRQSFSSASKLLKKPDQARALCFISHIYWTAQIAIEKNQHKPVHDGEKVLNCLNKAIKITNQCLNNDVKAQLYTDILNTAHILHQKGCTETLSQKFLTDLIEKVNTELIDKSITSAGSIDEKERINPLIIRQYKSIEKLILKNQTAQELADQIKYVKI